MVFVSQATQLRLNAELDAGALAAISDMESYLRAPPARPTATTKKANGGASSSISNSNYNNRTSPIQAVVKVNPRTAMAGGGGGRGKGRGAGVAARAPVASAPPGPAARSATAVSRGLGGGMWGDTTTSHSTTNNNSAGQVNEDGMDHQFHRVEQQSRGNQHGAVAMATAAGGIVGDAATATPSTLFRLSERVKEAARASGERTLLKVTSGSNLSPGARDYANTHGNDHSTSVNIFPSIVCIYVRTQKQVEGQEFFCVCQANVFDG